MDQKRRRWRRQQQQQQQQKRSQHSPVDRKIALNAETERRLGRNSQDRPKPLDLSTSAKLRYLDDEDYDQDASLGQESPPAAEIICQRSGRAIEMFEKVRDHKKCDSARYLQQAEFIGLNDNDSPDHIREDTITKQHNYKIQENTLDDEDTPSLEEVYLCTCCGITKPLDPAMKYMALFRSSFFLFNFLVFAFNFADLAMGLWFRIDPKVYEIYKYIETQNFTYAGYILLAGGLLGCLISLVGFAGAARVCAAKRNNAGPDKQPVCLLISYALTMTLMTVAYVGALVLLTVYGLGPPLERHMTKEMYEQMRRRQMSSPESGLVLPNQNDATQFLDFVQVKLRCCGAQDWRDYSKLGLNVPSTCFTYRGNMIDAPGCGRALRDIFDVRAGLAAGATAASVIAQLVAALLASLMVCSIYNYRAQPRPASSAGSYSTPTHNERVTTSPPPQLGLTV